MPNIYIYVRTYICINERYVPKYNLEEHKPTNIAQQFMVNDTETQEAFA